MTTTEQKRRGEVRAPPKIKRASKQVAKTLVKSILDKMAFIEVGDYPTTLIGIVVRAVALYI